MKFKPTTAQISAAETVFLAKTLLALIEPIVTAYQRDILRRGQWKTAPQFGEGSEQFVVTDPKNAWLLSDADFAVYDAQCKAARVSAGLYVENPEQCPKLVAEDHVRLAERELVNALQPATKLSADDLLISGMKNYKNYVETSLKLMAPFVDRGAIMERVTAPAAPAMRGGASYERPGIRA